MEFVELSDGSTVTHLNISDKTTKIVIINHVPIHSDIIPKPGLFFIFFRLFGWNVLVFLEL